jgi:hypothetical protein
MIEQLPLLAPNSTRTDRTRARCHQKLARLSRPCDQKRFLVERAVLLSFGTIYLSSLALAVARMMIR